MSFVKILAPVIGTERDKAVLGSAFAAARLFNAHIVALFVRPDITEAVPFYGENVSGALVQEIADVSKKAADSAASAVRATIAACATNAGGVVVATPELGSAPTVSFREALGNFADQVTRAARLSDLVVFSTLNDNERPGLTEAFEATLLETGRPVLLSANPAPPNFCGKIAVAWNESVASAHAVSAALPFLKQAKEVEILSVRREKDEAIDSGELKTYLRLHGMAPAERVVDGGNKAVAQVLLDAATEGGAGLLVAGGYGHSRLREMFFSGVTRHVVNRAALPCFLVH